MSKKVINENKAKAIMLGDDPIARMELCRHSFRLFFMYYYAMYHHFKTPQFHLDMFQDLEDLESGEINELLWLMFRESAKSSIAKAFAKAWVTWMILYEKKHFIIYDSYKKANAEQALIDIANSLRSNELITNDFGFVLGKKGSKDVDEEFTEQRSGGFTTVPSKSHPTNNIDQTVGVTKKGHKFLQKKQVGLMWKTTLLGMQIEKKKDLKFLSGVIQRKKWSLKTTNIGLEK